MSEHDPNPGDRGQVPTRDKPVDQHQHGDCARCGRGHQGRGCCLRRAGGRARKGWIRVAILALLAERPMHGYEMITELVERTAGAWNPSPGSVYPALQLLADEGLISPEGEDTGRRRYALSPAGQAVMADHDPHDTPWGAMAPPLLDPTVATLRQAVAQLDAATGQVLVAGSADQRTRAVGILSDARRALYLLLAEGD